jgi:symplekin
MRHLDGEQPYAELCIESGSWGLLWVVNCQSNQAPFVLSIDKMMRRDSGKRNSLDDPLAALQQQQQDDNMSDDDNAAPDMQSEVELEAEKEDPLLLAIDDLEGRVVSALDDVKLHPGVRSSPAPGSPSVHEELATLLRPVLEVAAHTGPSVARTYYPVVPGGEGVEASCEDVYKRVVSDLVLPVMLEMAQSDTIPAKRAASLEFFHNFWKECHKAGSWLEKTTTGLNVGPYGSGGSSHAVSATTLGMRNQQKRRHAKKMEREAEILRYWVHGSIACTLPGAFTSEASEGSVASRGIIAASASLRPSLKHIAERIQDADDRGAARLYGPVMKMVEGVLKKLFLSTEADSLRSACIKFVEIVVLCCSSKAQLTTTGSAARQRSQNVRRPEMHLSSMFFVVISRYCCSCCSFCYRLKTFLWKTCRQVTLSLLERLWNQSQSTHLPLYEAWSLWEAKSRLT